MQCKTLHIHSDKYIPMSHFSVQEEKNVSSFRSDDNGGGSPQPSGVKLSLMVVEIDC